MSTPTPSSLGNTAQLARLAISVQELSNYQRDIDKILNYMGQLNQLDLSQVTPTAHIAGLTNATRPDEACESIYGEALIAQFPAVVEDSLVKVPAVLPEEGES